MAAQFNAMNNALKAPKKFKRETNIINKMLSKKNTEQKMSKIILQNLDWDEQKIDRYL